MTLQNLAKEQFNNQINSKFIGIYHENKKIYPEYADEILETYGNKEVIDYKRVNKQRMDILVVELKED